MRVGILTTSYPRWRDDLAGSFVEALARELASTYRWDVRVLAPHGAGARRQERIHGVEIRRFRYAWPDRAEALCYQGGIPTTLKLRPWTRLLLPGFLAGFLYEAVGFAEDCDVIHCHWTVTAVAGLAAGAVHRAPVVVTTLGSDIGLAGKSSALRKLNRHVVRRADAVVVIGSHQRAELVGLGCPGRRIEHIPLGIGGEFLDRPPSAEKTVDVLFVGRMTPEKRPELLLEALANLARRGRKVVAEFVGDGPLRAKLARRLEREDLPSVKLLGRLPEHGQVVEAMDRARCLALVSSREGLPNVVLEAMARGMAVLACDVGSVSDLVRRDETGVLLDADVSGDALATAIEELLADPRRLRRLGRNAREFVRERFSWTRTAGQYDRLYRRLIAARARPA